MSKHYVGFPTISRWCGFKPEVLREWWSACESDFPRPDVTVERIPGWSEDREQEFREWRPNWPDRDRCPSCNAPQLFLWSGVGCSSLSCSWEEPCL